MLTKLTLAAMAGLFLQVEAVKQPPTAPPQKLNAILCQTEAQAIALAAAQSAGKTEPTPIHLVNKPSARNGTRSTKAPPIGSGASVAPRRSSIREADASSATRCRNAATVIRCVARWTPRSSEV